MIDGPSLPLDERAAADEAADTLLDAASRPRFLELADPSEPDTRRGGWEELELSGRQV